MQESEIWITRIFNDHFAGFANSILGIVGIHSKRPWTDSMVMQLLVALLLMVTFAILRMRQIGRAHV